MKFTCHKKDLLNVVAMTDVIANSKINFSISSNILFKLEKNILTIESLNNEMSFSAPVTVKMMEEGSITLSQKKIYNILKELPEDDLLIELKDNNVVFIKPLSQSKNAEIQIIGISSEEFPKIEKFNHKEENSIKIDCTHFKKMIQKTIFCVSNNQNFESNINGILLEFENDILTMVATDARRLAVFNTNIPESKSSSFKTILSFYTLNYLSRVLPSEGDLYFSFDNGKIYFAFEEVQLSTNVISGSFIEYKVFLSKDHNNKASGIVRDLISGLNLAGSIIENDSYKVVLEFAESNLNIKVEHNHNSSNEDIFVNYEGEPLKLAINCKYLLELLRQIETEEVEILINDSIKPCTIKEKNRDEFLYVIMPIRLENE